MNHLSDADETTKEEFQESLERGCIKMNEYMCNRYHDIARKASFLILDLIFDSGNSTLMADIEKEGPLAVSDIEMVVKTQYQNCREAFGVALGLWSVPSDVHYKFENKFIPCRCSYAFANLPCSPKPCKVDGHNLNIQL